MSDPQQTIETLRRFNQWRRGDESIEQPDPTEIGIAIDDAIKCIEQRDILVEALHKIAGDRGEASAFNLPEAHEIADEALAAIISTGVEPEDVLIESRKPNQNDCPKCGFGLSDEWPDGRRVCDDCDHEWFKAPDPVRVYPSPCNR
jgi:NADH pyrophosphatase NudC (nudix superfamily)